MLWPPKDSQPAQLSLRAECLQDVSEVNNTDIPILSSKIKTGHFSNEPNSERYPTHPEQLLGETKPELQSPYPHRDAKILLPNFWKVGRHPETPRRTSIMTNTLQVIMKSQMIADT